ncbi:MAG: DUF559 domain-containing protein [Planctomycetales bacterium]|nr:DUF559 domain-containing protein [Planctomycetales bacterium]
MKRKSLRATSPDRGELLVAIMNSLSDFETLKSQGWYRVPVDTAPKRWPPQWLAFYQTKAFEEEAHTVRYFGRVGKITQAPRRVLFPNERENAKSGRVYYKVQLESLQERPQPILSRRWRRIVFIPTTMAKFVRAEEINDLFDDSPLEDALWQHFCRQRIPAERQWEWRFHQDRYMLDFAVFCNEGNIDIETDGDSYHANPEASVTDNERNNALSAAGWNILRFSSLQINDRAEDYCVPKVLETINRLGGLKEDTIVPRKFYVLQDGTAQQLALFESGADYDLD